MKRLNKLGYIALGAIIALTVSMTVPAVAASIQKQITAYYNGIKIYIDGELITPKDGNGKIVEPFVSDGTTYLPVRAVGEAFGKSVEWDGTTQSVYIGQKPGAVQYLTDICPAYQVSGSDYKEYSALKSGGAESFSLGGVKYLDGITLPVFEGRWGVYNFNSQYTSLSGVICHLDGTDSISDGGSIQFFCDDMLVKEIQVSTDMFPENFSISLVGVNQLKIVAVPTWNGGYVGIGNPILK
jgi:hypothetical protein